MALKKMSWKNLSCPCNMFCRRLGLVIWKNLLLRKVQWVVTLFELLFPLFPVIFILAIAQLPKPKGVTFPKISEKNMTWNVPRYGYDYFDNPYEKNWCRSITDDLIAYTPIHPTTTKVMQKAAKYLCTGDNPSTTVGLLPVADESDLEKQYASLGGSKLHAGVVFMDDLSDLSSPKVISYKIRMSPEAMPSTSSLFPRPDPKDPFGIKRKGNDYTRVGPNKDNEQKYIKSGFIGLQLFLDKALMEELTKPTVSPTVTLTLQPMAYPPFLPVGGSSGPGGSALDTIFSGIFYQGVTWGMCFMIPAVTRNVVGEKQTGIKELLRLAGVSAEIQWLGWLIHAGIPGAITMAIIVILMGTSAMNEPLLRAADPTFVWFLFFLYVLTCATFIFAVCSIFQKPTIATTVAELIWVVSILVGQFYILLEPFIPLYIKLPMQLLPNIVLCSAILSISRLETIAIDDSDNALGARWTTLLASVPQINPFTKEEVFGFSTLYVIGFFMLDICLYMLLAVYLDGVLPTEFGVRRPWYYFNCHCQCSRPWGRGRARVAPAMMPPPPPPVMPAPSSTSASDSGSQSQQGENDASKPEKEGKHKHHHHHEHKHKHKHDKPQEEGEKEKPEVTPSTEQNALPSQPSLQQPVVMSVTGFEAEPIGAIVGVETFNLYKKFGRKVAVNGVSLRMYSGDIFALLGHNGAGKTTLISMLTGFFAPTSGTAIIGGYDITRDLEKARKSIGLCTQHNVLFERLTVSQQLCIFGMLRGLSKKKASEEGDWLLRGMSIYDKRNTLAKNLSGGQKRKLCLSMALIGGTKVVVLDEPTSGMDPQARREIWDILLNLRGNRTVLLTTHFMEEADFLGDRIGIMASGQLQCCGTPAFLKKFYGTGYTLKLTLGQQPEAPSQGGHSPAADAALAAVQKHIPNARFKADARADQASNEVFLSLPSETATTTALSKMFVDLTANKDKLGIKTMGLSQTTMDEVFVKVGEIVEEQQHGGHVGQTTELDIESIGKAPKAKNPIVTQFMSLCIKRAIHSWRKWITLIFETVIPVLLVVLLVHMITWNAEPVPPKSGYGGRSIQTKVRSSPEVRAGATPEKNEVVLTNISLPVNLDVYPKPVITYYSGDSEDLMPKVINNAKSTSNVPDALVSAGKSDRKFYKRNHIVAAEFASVNQAGGSVEFNGLFNLYPYHAAPLAINLGTNYLLKLIAPDKDYSIEVTNHPFFNEDPEPEVRSSQARQHFEPNPKAKLWTPVKSNSSIFIKKMHGFLVLALLFLVANFIAAPIEERLCKAKQLQLMTGAGPPVYWGAFFTWDYLFYSIVIGVMLAYVFVIDFWVGYKVVTRGWALPVLILILMIYGCSAIVYSYLLSLRPSSLAGGFSLVTFLHLITGLLFGTIVNDESTSEIDGFFSFIGVAFQWTCYVLGRLCPTFTLFRALRMYLDTAVDNSDCPLLSAENTTCPEPDPFIRWKAEYNQTRYVRKNNGPGYEEITPKSKPLLGQEILFLTLVGLLYLGLLMLFEYKLINMVSRKLFKSSGAFPPNINDEDVYNEMQRVNELVTTRQVAQECLVVHNLCKSFGSFAAVSQLHFGVHYGECFGLLGVNGAGKTTAFRMITGDETPTTGNAFGFGTSIETDSKRFFSNIGYCPQFDAILDKFTGREMLQLFAGLRGIPYRAQKQEAMSWLKRFGLQDSANAKCGRYSGGMKRRLSTAMAMIGDPSLILLDEPTSGVDPVSRRQFWKILDKVRESGKSIILTSHSMEECEALCSRLGIMVNGQFQCFGGVQHLKNKFAQGYSLSVKLKQDLLYGTPEVEEQIHTFEEAISKRFEPCIQKDKHQNVMQYHLQNPAITWDVLFKLIEEIKAEFQHLVEDFAVNETSLEEVFLAFARMQYPERKANVSLCAQICTCSC